MQQHVGHTTDMSTHHLFYRAAINCSYPVTSSAANRNTELLATTGIKPYD